MQNSKIIPSGPIVIVEDDMDDQFILQTIFTEMGIEADEIVFFLTPGETLAYLQATTVQPFLIISDINLPQYNGLELKRIIDQNEELKKKSIPFIFMSTSIDSWVIEKAYTDLSVQGYFQKPSSYEEMKQLMECVLSYWQVCKHPHFV